MAKIPLYQSSETGPGVTGEALTPLSNRSGTFEGGRAMSAGINNLAGVLKSHADRITDEREKRDAMGAFYAWEQNNIDTVQSAQARKDFAARDVLNEYRETHAGTVERFGVNSKGDRLTGNAERIFAGLVEASHLRSSKVLAHHEAAEQVAEKTLLVEEGYITTARQLQALPQTPEGDRESVAMIEKYMDMIDAYFPDQDNTRVKSRNAARLSVDRMGYEEGVKYLQDKNNFKKLNPEDRDQLINRYRREESLKKANDREHETRISRAAEKGLIKKLIDNTLTDRDLVKALPSLTPGSARAFAQIIKQRADAARRGVEDPNNIDDPAIKAALIKKVNTDPGSVDIYKDIWDVVGKGISVPTAQLAQRRLEQLTDASGDPLKSFRAREYFGILDRLRTDSYFNSESNLTNELIFSEKSASLQKFFMDNPDATAQEAAVFFDGLVKEEKENWVKAWLDKIYEKGKANAAETFDFWGGIGKSEGNDKAQEENVPGNGSGAAAKPSPVGKGSPEDPARKKAIKFLKSIKKPLTEKNIQLAIENLGKNKK